MKMKPKILLLIVCVCVFSSHILFARHGRAHRYLRSFMDPCPFYNQFKDGSNYFHRRQIHLNSAAQRVNYAPWSIFSKQTNEIILVAGRPIGSGWLGVSLARVNDGLIITELVQNSPACIGRLTTGDIIAGINGRRITNINTFDGVLDKTVPGERIRLVVFRNKKRKTVYLRVGRQ